MRITGLLCSNEACSAGHYCSYGGTISAWQRPMSGPEGGMLAVAPIGVEGSLLVSKSTRGAEPSTLLDAREHWALTYDGVLYNATALRGELRAAGVHERYAERATEALEVPLLCVPIDRHTFWGELPRVMSLNGTPLAHIHLVPFSLAVH
jgi:hypothetical protein